MEREPENTVKFFVRQRAMWRISRLVKIAKTVRTLKIWMRQSRRLR